MRFDLCHDSSCSSFADEATGVHTLTFLANSGQKMTNGLTVELSTLRAPLADGSLKLISELSDDDRLTLPLLIDHAPSIDAQAGAVHRLWLTEAGLMAEATVTEGTEAGAKVTALANADALTNSFSITVESAKAPGDDGVIHDAELVEISVVFRGADQRAAFNSFNSRGEKMTTALDKFAIKLDLTQDQADELKTIIDEAAEQQAATLKSAVDAKTGTDTDDEDTAPIEEAVAVENTRFAPAMQVTQRETWVDSPEGVNAFARTIFENAGADAEQVTRLWRNRVQEEATTHAFGVTYDPADTPLPKPVAEWIHDALNTDEHEVWASFNHTGMEAATALFRDNDLDLKDPANRANFYPQASWGTEKTEQANTLKPRTVRPGFFAKYIAVNRGDIELTRRNRGDESVLLRYLTTELVNRTIASLEYDALLGADGNDGSAGLFSVASDALAANGYATLTTLDDKSPAAVQIAKAAAAVRGAGKRTLVTSREYLADLRFGTTDSPLLIPFDGGLERMLGVDRIITPDWFGANAAVEGGTAKAVIYAGEEYKTVGDRDAELFQNFALKTNQNEFLSEIWTGGGLLTPGAGALIVAGE